MSVNTFFSNRRCQFLLAFVVLGMMTMLIVVPYSYNSQAVVSNKATASFLHGEADDLPNYDVRTDERAAERLATFRNAAGKNTASVEFERRKFERAEAALRQAIPTLKIEYNEDLRAPEVIAPDALAGGGFLSRAATGKRADILRSFVESNNELVGLTDRQIDDLRVTADYTNPDGVLSFAHLEQFINGVPVFRGEIKAGFTTRGEIIRVINNLAPALDDARLSNDFGSAETAARFAFGHLDRAAGDLKITKSTDLRIEFNDGEIVAEKMYFPTEAGVARTAWRVLIWSSAASYYVVVDAETGAMLWRKNISDHQTQPATYNVYANTSNMLKIADSPAPLLPAPLSPLFGTQGVLLNRTNVTLVGNEAPYTFNNLGWITDGNSSTEGNNTIAGLDRATPNGVDAPVAGTNRQFVFNYNPAPGNPASGEEPLPAGQTRPCATAVPPINDFGRGAVTNMFYAVNRYHDEMYLLGFTEQARNFQADNFGRGGVGADRVLAEGQDCSGENNANFQTPADGTGGRMQMYLFTAPAPDRDGTLDNGVIIHELTHGTSNRLHGNASGLQTNMAGGMGEGWSDFYAHALLSEPTHPINGIYTVGGYAVFNLATVGTTNYYYGIRRFPKALITVTGPNGKPHSPLTFRHLNSNCNDEIGTPNGIGTISAFPRGVIGAATCDQVHNAGEIWSSALWEVRGRFVQRLGWETGNRKALQYVTDGMKLAPLNPTFLQERDAILSAARASGGTTDYNDVFKGFAARGMGFSARIVTSASPASVVEAFDDANLLQTPTFSVADPNGNNNGSPEPGERINLTIPLKNPINEVANNVTLQIVGGGTADYGTIEPLATVTRTVEYTVPANTVCGSVLSLTFNVNSNLGPVTLTKQIVIGTPTVTLSENFDGVTAPSLPAGWTSTATGAGTNFATAATVPDTAPNSVFASAPATAGGSDLTSPAIPIASQAAILTFRHSYNLQTSFDGATLEIKIGGGVFRNIESAGGSFLENGFNLNLQGTGNPIANQRGWNGNSNGYVTSSVRLPIAAAGQTVQFRFRLGHNGSIASPAGWHIDTIRVSGDYTCAPATPAKARADFDGDGKTDVSVYRGGIWYVNRSQAGFTGAAFGAASDITVPGDYDGDNKTDYAVFRPSANAIFYVLNSSNNTFTATVWGTSGDIPLVGDFTGDGKDDYVVVRNSTYTWYILPSSGGGTFISGSVGQPCDRPVVGDFDGDGKADIAGIQGGNWIIRNSSTNQITTTAWGLSSDRFVPADYDNDGKDDLAVFRSGIWYIRRSSNGSTLAINFGAAGDVPVPGDYDGDGADDQAVFRNGTWYALRSTAGFQATAFGIGSDTPIPSRYIP